MKDAVLLQIQKTFRHGNDLAKCLRDMNYQDPISKPVRACVDVKNYITTTITGTGTTSAEMTGITKEDELRMTIEQRGHDLEYTQDLQTWKQRMETFEENKAKAAALIFGHCNKIMQNCIKEMPTYDLIRDDPTELLTEIKKKM